MAIGINNDGDEMEEEEEERREQRRGDGVDEGGQEQGVPRGVARSCLRASHDVFRVSTVRSNWGKPQLRMKYRTRARWRSEGGMGRSESGVGVSRYGIAC
jgi:hypothetical protein